jgi:hypothetical protein
MRLEAVHPLGPVIDGVALNITVQSYDSSLFVGINACSAAVPDVPALAAAMSEELKALLEAAGEKSEEDRSTAARHRAMAAAAAVVRARPHGSPPTAHLAAASNRRQLPTVHRGMSWD